MITTKTADNVLKSYYLDVVSDQLDKAVNPLLAQINKTTADVLGKDVRKTVRFGVNGGIGAGTEDGNLPAAKGNRYAQFVTSLKNLYGTVEISDKAIRSSANSEGAFVNLLNDEMDGLVKSSSYNFGRMLFGDGTGKLCTVLALTTAAESGTASETIPADSVKNIEVGMTVDIYNVSGNFVKTSVVTSVDRTAKHFTLDNGAENVSEGCILYVQGSKDNEITGLGAIFNAPTLYGVNRAENSWMKPVIKNHSSAAVSELLMQTVIDEVEEKSGSKINFIVTTWGVRRALIENLSAYRSLEAMQLEGGFTALSYNGIPIVADRFCPDGTMYFLNTDDFALHQLCDWQWLEGEDGKILKQIPGKPVYSATLVKYAELMCYRPAGQAMVTGISEK